MKFRNLKLGTKLTLGFGLIILIALVLGVLAVRAIQNINETVHKSTLVAETVNHIDNALRHEKNFLIRKKSEYVDKTRTAIENILKTANEAKPLFAEAENIKRMEDIISSTEQYQIAFENVVTKQNEIDKIYGGINALAGKIENLCDQNFYLMFLKVRIDAKDMMVNASDERVAALHNGLNKMDNMSANSKNEEFKQLVQNYISDYTTIIKNKQELAKLDEDMVAMRRVASEACVSASTSLKTQMVGEIRAAYTEIFILLVVAIVLGIFAAVLITRAIANPLKKGVEFAVSIANGNLLSKIDYQSTDEVGQLAKALTDMADNLRRILNEIGQGADNISAASMEMSSSSQTVSQGASEQAASTEEISSSMEEMTANIHQNTDNANQTQAIASKAVKSIREGYESTENAVLSMREIAEKIKIINDIAFQTNILALNAAVEAARAGEHGKGFAVVASEVRKLAERSKVAADEINKLSVHGVSVSEKAGKQLADLVPEIEKTANLVLEISAASNEQNNGASQINLAIQQLSQITQQNAAASEEMASGAEELASQAETLKDLISFFKTDENAERSQYKTRAFDNDTPKQYHQTPKKVAAKQGNGSQASTKPKSGKPSQPAQKGNGVLLSFSETENDKSFERY